MIHLLFTILFILHLAASESLTIARGPAYLSQRPCAQNCFSGGIYTGGGVLAQGIDCEDSNPQNECVCRADLQDDADAYLQHCVSIECSANTLDINSAVSIYDEYCTAAGYLRSTPAMITSDSSTSPPSSSSSSSSPKPQQTLHTSQTSSLISSNSVEDSSSRTGTSETQAPAPTDTASGGNGLGTGDIVGIVIGVLGFIATAIGTYFTWKSIMSKRSPRQMIWQ